MKNTTQKVILIILTCLSLALISSLSSASENESSEIDRRGNLPSCYPCLPPKDVQK